MALFVYFSAQMKDSGTQPGPRILVPAPAAAGGLTRDYAAERTIYRVVLAQLRSRFKPAWLGAASSYTAAVYDELGRTDPAAKGPVRLIFLGVNAASSFGDPSTNLSTYMAGIAAGIAGHGAVGRPTQVRAGPGGGSAECAKATAGSGRATMCVWATSRTIGTLPLPPVTQASANLRASCAACAPTSSTVSKSSTVPAWLSRESSAMSAPPNCGNCAP